MNSKYKSKCRKPPSRIEKKRGYVKAFTDNNLNTRNKEIKGNITSNLTLNSIIAKLIGGKRVNYALKNSYSTRCMLATINKNNKRPIYSLHKALYKKSPFKKSNVKALEILRKQKQDRQNESRSKTKRFRKQLFKNVSTDVSYGNDDSKPDMDEEDFNRLL